MKTIEVVAAAIYNDEDELFISQRTDGDFKGLWEFPGGKIEEGETHQQALIREIKEELELNIEVGEFVNTVNYDYPTFHLIMHTYKCKIVSGHLVQNVHSDTKWIKRSEIKNIKWVPADIEVAIKLS